jgi:hypothetical protein
MADKFPRAYRNSVPQDLDHPDNMIERVPFSHTHVGARKSVLKTSGEYSNPFTLKHIPDQNGH